MKFSLIYFFIKKSHPSSDGRPKKAYEWNIKNNSHKQFDMITYYMYVRIHKCTGMFDWFFVCLLKQTLVLPSYLQSYLRFVNQPVVSTT